MYTSINILIFEGNAQYRNKLESIIRQYHLSLYPDNAIALSTNNPNEVLHYIKTVSRFTVYLLDVSAQQKNTGLFLANQVKQSCPKHPVVFMTHRTCRLLTNMKCKLLAFAFILKDSPLLKDEISLLLRHFTSLVQQITPALRIESRFEEILISFHNIYYIEPAENGSKVKIVCKDRICEMKGSLTRTEKILDGRFLRVSRRSIVNTDKIININRSKHMIELRGSHVIPYSNTYLKENLKNI